VGLILLMKLARCTLQDLLRPGVGVAFDRPQRMKEKDTSAKKRYRERTSNIQLSAEDYTKYYAHWNVKLIMSGLRPVPP